MSLDVLGAFGMLGTYCVGFSKGLEKLVSLELNQKLRFLSQALISSCYLFQGEGEHRKSSHTA